MAKAPTHHKYVKTQPSFEFASATDTHQNRVTTQNIRSKIQPINAHLKNPQPSPEPNMPRKSSIQQALSNNLDPCIRVSPNQWLTRKQSKTNQPAQRKNPTPKFRNFTKIKQQNRQIKHSTILSSDSQEINMKYVVTTSSSSIKAQIQTKHSRSKHTTQIYIITHTNTKQHITNKYTGKHSLKLINLQSVFNTATTNRNQKHIRVTQPRSILTPKALTNIPTKPLLETQTCPDQAISQPHNPACKYRQTNPTALSIQFTKTKHSIQTTSKVTPKNTSHALESNARRCNIINYPAYKNTEFPQSTQPNTKQSHSKRYTHSYQPASSIPTNLQASLKVHHHKNLAIFASTMQSYHKHDHHQSHINREAKHAQPHTTTISSSINQLAHVNYRQSKLIYSEIHHQLKHYKTNKTVTPIATKSKGYTNKFNQMHAHATIYPQSSSTATIKPNTTSKHHGE
eukprot:gene3479-2430_t